MKFGVCLPQYGKSVTLDDLRAIAEDAEAMGFDSVWVSDHIVTPGHMQGSVGPMFMDAFVVLSHVSAITRRVKLGTTVMVVPYRNPLVAAKTISTLDVLSGGRVVLGVGAGGAPDEFDALGVPESQRGSRTDEYLSVMIELWTTDPTDYQGRYVAFSGVRFGPKPTQQPHPPIWVGGRSDAALRRAVRFGQAWHPTSVALEALRERMSMLHELSYATGRERPPETTVHQAVDFSGGPAAYRETGERRLGHGSPELVIGDLDAYHGLGIETVVCNFRSTDVAALRRAMETFAAKVTPELPAG